MTCALQLHPTTQFSDCKKKYIKHVAKVRRHRLTDPLTLSKCVRQVYSEVDRKRSRQCEKRKWKICSCEKEIKKRVRNRDKSTIPNKTRLSFRRVTDKKWLVRYTSASNLQREPDEIEGKKWVEREESTRVVRTLSKPRTYYRDTYIRHKDKYPE